MADKGRNPPGDPTYNTKENKPIRLSLDVPVKQTKAESLAAVQKEAKLMTSKIYGNTNVIANVQGHQEYEDKMTQKSLLDTLLQEVGQMKNKMAGLEDRHTTKALASDMIDVRMRFLETYRRSKYRMGNKRSSWDQDTLDKGHGAAHDGRINYDRTLYSDGHRKDDTTFRDVYGVTLQDFDDQYKPHRILYNIFNARGALVVEAARQHTVPSNAFLVAFRAILPEVNRLIGEGAGPEEVQNIIEDTSTTLSRTRREFLRLFEEQKARFEIWR